MRPRTLCVLGLVAILLGGYVVLVERRQQTTDEKQLASRRIVPELHREQLQQITIERGAAVISLLRREGTWWLEAPAAMQGRADDSIVDQLLSAVEFLEYQRTLPTDGQRRAAGLKPPAVRLRLQGGGARVELALGQTDPSGKGVYLEYRGRVFVVGRGLLQLLSREPGQLRDPRLLTLDRAAVRLLRVAGIADPSPLPVLRRETGNNKYRHSRRALAAGRLGAPARSGIGREAQKHDSGREVVLRQAAGRWTVDHGEHRVWALQGKVVRLLGALLNLRAARFPARPGGRPETSWITIEGPGGTTQIRAGGPCPGRPAERLLFVRQGAVKGGTRPRWVSACVTSEDLGELSVDRAALLDLSPTRLQLAGLSRVELQRPQARLVLTRDAGRWMLEGGVQADPDLLRSWVRRLRDLRGSLDLRADPGELFATGSITLETEDGKQQRVQLGRVEAGRVLARRGDQARLWFPGQLLALLRTDTLALRHRRVLELSPYHVSSLILRRQGRSQEHHRTEKGWSTAGKPASSASAKHLDRLTRRLSALRATSFLSARPTLTAPLTIRVELSGKPLQPTDAAREPKVVELQVGSTTTGTACPVLLGGQPMLLPPEACADLREGTE